MTQVILLAGVTQVNTDLLDRQLKTAAPNDCYGLNIDINGVHIVVSDTIDNALLQTLKAVASAHNAAEDTPEQATTKTGKANIAALLASADSAIADLTAKRAAAVATPNISTVGALVLSITDTLLAVVKCLKYILIHYN